MICLVFLAPAVGRVVKDYTAQKKLGLDPVFEPEKLGIKGADAWTIESPPACVQAAMKHNAALREDG